MKFLFALSSIAAGTSMFGTSMEAEPVNAAVLVSSAIVSSAIVPKDNFLKAKDEFDYGDIEFSSSVPFDYFVNKPALRYELSFNQAERQAIVNILREHTNSRKMFTIA